MPTPQHGDETREEWMDRCIPMMVDEGMEQDQAAAACAGMWDAPKSANILRRAYSLFEVKAMDEERRELEGIATTPTPDRVGDIIEPRGAEFKLPLPLIWQHDASQPVGEVYSAKVTKSGISVKAKIAKTDEPGRLKDRLDEVWQSIKLKLVRGFSIGFSPLEQSQIQETYSYRYSRWEWLELSLVTIPANAEATIQVVKSLDTELRIASDQRRGIVRLDREYIRRVSRPKTGVVYID